tara:strand:- start:385 stop:930 length:546 start_codon:yes stop_codon:yes gene_type:complete
MTNKYVGAAQFVKNLITGGKKSGDGKAIKSFKPGTKFEGIPKYQKEIIKARSNVQKSFKPINEGIANETRQLRQKLQGMRGERITQSGISKGKDVTPGIYEPKKKIEKKAKGGRIGYKRGTGLMPKKKSNVDKIKKTFGPKNLGMQSVIYGLDKNPKITKADPKAKFIAAANKKKKKKKLI